MSLKKKKKKNSNSSFVNFIKNLYFIIKIGNLFIIFQFLRNLSLISKEINLI